MPCNKGQVVPSHGSPKTLRMNGKADGVPRLKLQRRRNERNLSGMCPTGYNRHYLNKGLWQELRGTDWEHWHVVLQQEPSIHAALFTAWLEQERIEIKIQGLKAYLDFSLNWKRQEQPSNILLQLRRVHSEQSLQDWQSNLICFGLSSQSFYDALLFAFVFFFWQHCVSKWQFLAISELSGTLLR